MKELLYTVLELEKWNARSACFFCHGSDNKAVCQIRTRNPITHKIIANDCACEECKEKFENNELPKCERCGRLQDKSRVFIGNCRCVEHKEDTEKKELPVLPHEERASARYEQQINALREEKNQLTTEVETHLEALEISEDWHKKQKQELLDEIDRLKKENTAQGERIRQLENQLAQLNNQSTAQIEVKETKKWPWKFRK